MFLSSLNQFIARDPYPIRDERIQSGSRPYLYFSLIFFLGVFGIRSWQNIIHPGLYMEDAGHYFNIYYGGNLPLSTILQHPNGYYNVLNNFIAWIVAAKADVRIHALLYHLFSLSMGLVVALMMLFSGLLNSRVLLLITPIVLGLSGMNHIYYYSSLTFQMYNVVLILLCLLLFPSPKTWGGLVLACLLSALLVWSGPYSVVAAPIALLLLCFFQNTKKNILLVWVVACCLLYSFALRESMVRFENVLDPNLREIMIRTLFEKVFFLDLLGGMNVFNTLIFLVLLGVTFYVLRNNKIYLKLSLVLFGIIIGSQAPLFLSIKYLLYQNVFPCHLYVSQFFWLFFILYSFDNLLREIPKQHLIQYAFAAILLMIVLIDNDTHPEKGYKTPMKQIPAYLKAIYDVEQLNLEEKNQYALVITYNVIANKFPLVVKVGSRGETAQRVRRRYLPTFSGNQYVVD